MRLHTANAIGCAFLILVAGVIGLAMALSLAGLLFDSIAGHR